MLDAIMSSEWADKAVYYVSGISTFMGGMFYDMSVLTIFSISVMVVCATVSCTCQIVRTITDIRYKRKRAKAFHQRISNRNKHC